ncbi:MAG TPA: sulfite exporter TauE/SafE family protein [Candidatus Bathyarchaeia archaeon]|nr:sulfite exporter TauE/SafE family protein [Candidatus Bathyarchaeia archaeon]
MTALAFTVLTASLLGSLHCAGMCGGFVAFYAGAPGGRGGASHAAYNLGRLVAYAALGLLAGALGAATDLAAAPLGLQRTAAVLAALFVALLGLRTLLEVTGWRVVSLRAPAALSGAVARGAALAARWSPAARALAIGLLTGVLPCGWLYAFVLTAAGTGDPLRGAALMAVFWAGTLPVMAGLGVAVRAVAGRLGRYLPAACAVAMIVVALLAVVGRVLEPAALASHSAATHAHR